MTALKHSAADCCVDKTLDAVVVRIKASGQGHSLRVPSPDAVSRFVARVALETPMSQEEEEAWNQTWAHVIEEMRRRDDDDDVAEGRG
jgi:hypothetical protein